MFSTIILAVFMVILRIYGVASQYFMADEGSYQAVISNVSSCAQPPDWFQWNMTTYTSKGYSLLRGNVRYSRSIKELKFGIVMYYLEENKKTKVFDMKNQNCHNTIVEVILKTVRVPFNDKTCRMKPATSAYKDLNVDAIIHGVVESLWYGAAQLKLKAHERSTELMCLDVYFQIKKL